MEKTVVACDIVGCERTPAETVKVTIDGVTYVTDRCALHNKELMATARRPKRGRPRGSSKKRTTPKKATSRKTTKVRKKPTVRKKVS